MFPLKVCPVNFSISRWILLRNQDVGVSMLAAAGLSVSLPEDRARIKKKESEETHRRILISGTLQPLVQITPKSSLL